jgi:hypothetical protein
MDTVDGFEEGNGAETAGGLRDKHRELILHVVRPIGKGLDEDEEMGKGLQERLPEMPKLPRVPAVGSSSTGFEGESRKSKLLSGDRG